MYLVIPPGSTFLRLMASTLLLSVSQLALAVQDCELNGSSVNPANGSTTEGKTGIMRCKDRDSGLLVREQELRAGAFVGLVRYFKDGVLSKEFSVNAKGNQHGVLREYAPNGHLLLEQNNVDGRAQGLLREWHANGGLRRVEYFGEEASEKASVQYTPSQQLSGLRCGSKPLLAPHADDAALCGFRGAPSTVSKYSTNGKLREITTLLAGVSVKSTSFFTNSKPSVEEVIDGDKRVQRTYSEDGAKLKETLWSLVEKEAVLLRESEYHASGTLVHERLYATSDAPSSRRNRLVAESRFYLNGQAQSKDSFTMEGEIEFKEAKAYFDNGQLSRRGRYLLEPRTREKPIGVHQTFSQSGKPLLEIFYDDKGKRNRERTWDNSGTLVSDEAVFEDGSRKAFVK